MEVELELLVQLGRRLEAVEVLEKMMQRNPNRMELYRKVGL